MRILLVTLLVVAVIVLGYFLVQEREGRAIDAQQLAAVTAQLGGVRQQLQASEATLRSVQASRDELAARGNVITSIALRIELSCAVHTPTTAFPKIVTLVTLAKPDGTSLRFVDDTLAPSAVHNVTPERADIKLDYRPLHPGEILGHQLDDLRTISTLGLRYNDVLAALGLTLTDVTRVVLTINEIPTLQLEHLGNPPQGSASDFATIDVTTAFANVTTSYTRAVQERMRARNQ
jgi:hypothetical protein